jgi:FAD/FMN-containing dehydrogenase
MESLSRRGLLAAAGLGSLGLVAGGWGSPAQARTSKWAALERKLRGRLVRPDDSRYLRLAQPRNLRYTALLPKAVALCESAEDVSAAVRWARATDTPFAIRGGGHNYAAGSSSTGLIISTRRMARGGLTGSTLRTQAGARNRDLAAILPAGDDYYLLPGGNCPNVGVTGLTLGGGIGPNATWAGLTADHLREVSMVTADGEVVTANSSVNPDLFWGLRGGAGGNFGIVTDLTYDLVEVPVTRATTFRLQFSGIEAVADAGRAWQRARRNGGRLISGSWFTSRTADGVWCSVRGQMLAGEADTRAALAPLLAVRPTSTEIEVRPWWDAYRWYRTPVSPNNTFWDRSLYGERDLPDAALGDIARMIDRFPRPGSAFGGFQLLGWVGGRVNDVPATSTAYVHRSARWILETMSGWADPVDPTRWPTPVPVDIRDWVEGMWELLVPYSDGHSYQNFPDPELKNPARSYYGRNLDRLQRVKAAWDPDDVFTYPQGIPLPRK